MILLVIVVLLNYLVEIIFGIKLVSVKIYKYFRKTEKSEEQPNSEESGLGLGDIKPIDRSG